MPDKLEREIFRAAIATLEEVCFLIPGPAPGAESVEEKLAHAMRIGIRGAYEGEMQLAVSADVLPELARNMLGEDMPLSTEQQLDALGEVANIICGNILPAVAGSDLIFRLDAPELLESVDVPLPESTVRSSLVDVGIDEGCARIRLGLAEQPALVD